MRINRLKLSGALVAPLHGSLREVTEFLHVDSFPRLGPRWPCDAPMPGALTALAETAGAAPVPPAG